MVRTAVGSDDDHEDRLRRLQESSAELEADVMKLRREATKIAQYKNPPEYLLTFRCLTCGFIDSVNPEKVLHSVWVSDHIQDHNVLHGIPRRKLGYE